jgi:hypothetical protein
MRVEPNEIFELLGPSDIVHQAVGMISVQIDAGLRDAADRLLTESTATGKSVEAIAIDVVERSLRFA